MVNIIILCIHSPYKTCHVGQGPRNGMNNYFACLIVFFPFLSGFNMCFTSVFLILELSRDMRFPTMWYVRPAKLQTSLRLRTV